MSTNYYATVRIATIETEETSEFCFHIGKIGGGYSVAGNIFPSFEAMTDFLRANEARTTITSENGVVLELDELIELFTDSTMADRRRQYDWVQAEINTNARGQADYLRRTAGYSLDGQGFTISTAPFC